MKSPWLTSWLSKPYLCRCMARGRQVPRLTTLPPRLGPTGTAALRNTYGHGRCPMVPEPWRDICLLGLAMGVPAMLWDIASWARKRWRGHG